VRLSDKSCTGCKDNLNKYLCKIDTSQCKIIIISELGYISNLLRRESVNYVNNYFTKYNEIFFTYSKDNNITPCIILLNKKYNYTFGYKELFNETTLSDFAIKKINEFINSND
jgi:hypothetical protein